MAQFSYLQRREKFCVSAASLRRLRPQRMVMSDPALKSISSRLAEQDDDLVCYRFRCTTIAFARFADIQAAEDPAPQSPDSFWSELKEVFFQPSPPLCRWYEYHPTTKPILTTQPLRQRSSRAGEATEQPVSLPSLRSHQWAAAFCGSCELRDIPSTRPRCCVRYRARCTPRFDSSPPTGVRTSGEWLRQIEPFLEIAQVDESGT